MTATKKSGLPVPLDTSRPFVRAVADVIEGRGDIDTAISILAAAEAACGVALWTNLDGRFVWQQQGIYSPRDPASPPSIAEAVHLAGDAAALSAAFKIEAFYDGSARSKLRALIDRLGLIVAGVDFAYHHFARYDDGWIDVFNPQTWERLLSDWARQRSWPPGVERPLIPKLTDPLTFVFRDGLSDDIVEHYGAFLRVARDVIREKTLRAAPPHPPRPPGMPPGTPPGIGERDFLRSIYADPGDDEIRQVYGDWLMERGDPRGEFIALQYRRLAGALDAEGEARERELQKAHYKKWLGPLVRMISPEKMIFERGFVAAGLAHGIPEEEAGHVEWATVRELWFILGARVDFSPETMISLRAVWDISESAVRSLARGRTPFAIEALRCFGPTVEEGGLEEEALAPWLRMRSLPRLRRLSLLGFGDYLAYGDPAHFNPLWDSPACAGLEEVELPSSPSRLALWHAACVRRRWRTLRLHTRIHHMTAAMPDIEVTFTQSEEGRPSQLSLALGRNHTSEAASVVAAIDALPDDALTSLQVTGEPPFDPVVLTRLERAAHRQRRLKTLTLPPR